MLLYTRKAQYKYRDVTLLQQDSNGPCPLIAVTNALILKGHVRLPSQPHSSCIPIATVEDVVKTFLNTSQRSLFPENEHFQFSIDCAIRLLPKLRNGLDVNPKFDNIDAFEATDETSLFDACRLRLVHGLMMDEAGDAALKLEVGKASYNTMICKMTELEAAGDAASPTQHFFSDWIRAFPTQLTYRGLIDLTDGIAESEIAVLFRNNHFSVLTKEGGVLYTLVTDIGMSTARPDAVWESLVDVTGEASVFRDAYFGAAPAAVTTSAAAVQPMNTATSAVVEVNAIPVSSNTAAAAAATDYEPLVTSAPTVIDDDAPPPPPRRNSALVRRDDRSSTSQSGGVIQLNKEGMSSRSGGGSVPAALTQEYSEVVSESPHLGNKGGVDSERGSGVVPQKTKQDSCCTVM
eukprot:CAMPEP_0176410542 /NCGR_PEP_ID=MMETSP0127-20121128/3114_1 /TAXON_ID=938130 /ORGANISM="Platyophrya macrostoma, Strain WH" /LENGTH=404 /DNA_ID=CAMNT_0017790049 /DNA_START=138 /DNA_END=1352 /DNA_ORIENTATION=-